MSLDYASRYTFLTASSDEHQSYRMLWKGFCCELTLRALFIIVLSWRFILHCSEFIVLRNLAENESK